MPRKPWKIRGGSPERLPEVVYTFYTHGDFFEAEGFADKSDEELAALWQKYRTPIMLRYMAELRAKGAGWAGRRPTSFWNELHAAGHFQQATPPGAYSSERTWDRQRGIFDWVETDLQFLRRLNLLESWELEAVK